MNEPQLAIAILTARVLAGILFFFQGYDKVFKIGIPQVSATMKATLSGKNMNPGLVGFVAYFSSYAELICGFLLILGFFKLYASYILCFNILMVSAGFSMAKPMWDSSHVLIRVALLLFILIAPSAWDVLSVDHLFSISGLSKP